ncbi:trypsin-like serine protease [Plantactinospora sp. CA-290183]|uniref:trypsin-like serine protease n=1 Tax=Plantactinospora sp. CA-290183 TaxID=3240006 RepID=UPI003D8B81A7
MRKLLSGCFAAAAFAVAATQVVAPAAGNAAAPDSAALSAFSNTVFAQLSGPSGIGADLSYTGADPKTNQIEVGVVKPTAALVERLERKYGADRIRVVQAPIYNTTQLKVSKPVVPVGTTQDGVAPLAVGVCSGNGVHCAPTRGGVVLQQEVNGGYYLCTATIVGSARSGQRATLTAGHCFNRSGNEIAYGTTDFSGLPVSGWLGSPGERLYGGTSDHLVIPWDENTGWYGHDYPTNCLYTQPENCVRINFNAASSDYPTNTFVTLRGYTSGGNRTGGVVLPSATANIRDPETGQITTVTDLVQTSACALPGDSGGPAWTRDRLIGTISAGNFTQTDPPQCASAPRTFVAKATNAYNNLRFYPRLTP